eukprot:1903031-Rhodomonas_salina.4
MHNHCLTSYVMQEQEQSPCQGRIVFCDLQNKNIILEEVVGRGVLTPVAAGSYMFSAMPPSLMNDLAATTARHT